MFIAAMQDKLHAHVLQGCDLAGFFLIWGFFVS